MASPQQASDYPSNRQAIFTLAVLMLAYLVSFIDRQALSLMVTPIKADLGISDFGMSLLQGFAFALFFCALGIPLGRMADRYNRKYIIAAGVALWSIMTVLCGLANSYVGLFIARMGVGVGEAALAPAGYSLLADSFRKEKLVGAISAFTVGAMLGGGLAFLVGGLVMDYATNATSAPLGLTSLKPWQFTFIAIGLPGLLVAGLVLMIREPGRQDADKSEPMPFGKAFAYLWSRRRDFAPLYAAATFMAILSYGGLTWFPTHMIRAFGLTAGEAGVLLGTIHIIGPILGAAFGTKLTRALAERGRQDAPLITVMIVSIGGGLAFVAPLMPTLPLAAVTWFIFVVFQNGYYGNVLATIQTITPNRLRATNSAMLTLVVSLCGLGFGSAAIGGLADLFFAGDKAGIGKAMAIVGTVSGALAAISAALGRRRLRELMARGAEAF